MVQFVDDAILNSGVKVERVSLSFSFILESEEDESRKDTKRWKNSYHFSKVRLVREEKHTFLRPSN